MNLTALIAAITALVIAVGGLLHSLGIGRQVAGHLKLHRQFRKPVGQPPAAPSSSQGSHP